MAVEKDERTSNLLHLDNIVISKERNPELGDILEKNNIVTYEDLKKSFQEDNQEIINNVKLMELLNCILKKDYTYIKIQDISIRGLTINQEAKEILERYDIKDFAQLRDMIYSPDRSKKDLNSNMYLYHSVNLMENILRVPEILKEIDAREKKLKKY